MPLKIFEGSKEDYFEEIEKERLETYYLGPDLKKFVGEYEKRTNEYRHLRYPEEVWHLHFEKMQQKMAKKRHLPRRLRTHALGLETNVAVLVANIMMDGNANFRAEVTLPVDDHENLNRELMWATKDIAGVKMSVFINRSPSLHWYRSVPPFIGAQ